MATKHWTGASSSVFSTAGNWSDGVAPAAGDTLIVDSNATQGIAGSDESATGTFAALHVRAGFGFTIGTKGSPLKLACTLVHIGEHIGAGAASVQPTRVNIDLHTVTTSVHVHGTSKTTADASLAPVRIKATEASDRIYVRSGWVGIATDVPAQASTISRVDITGPDCDVMIGSGVTLTTLYKTAGAAKLGCAATTVTNVGGTLTTDGTGAITTYNANGGTNILNATGTIGTLNANYGTVDFTKSNAARTVTTLNLDQSKGAHLLIDPSIVTLTNGVALTAKGGFAVGGGGGQQN